MTPAESATKGHHPVCREDDVEALRTEGEGQAVALHERHPPAGIAHGLVEVQPLPKHAEGEVGRDHSSVLASEPAGALGRAGTDLEDPRTADVPEKPRVGLAQALRAPHEVGVTEEAAVLEVVLVRLTVPP